MHKIAARAGNWLSQQGSKSAQDRKFYTYHRKNHRKMRRRSGACTD